MLQKVPKSLNNGQASRYECSLTFCFFLLFFFSVCAEMEYGSRAPLKDAVSFLSKYFQQLMAKHSVTDHKKKHSVKDVFSFLHTWLNFKQ